MYARIDGTFEKRIFATVGFEPGSSAWEADLVPLGQRCIKSMRLYLYIFWTRYLRLLYILNWL